MVPEFCLISFLWWQQWKSRINPRLRECVCVTHPDSDWGGGHVKPPPDKQPLSCIDPLATTTRINLILQIITHTRTRQPQKPSLLSSEPSVDHAKVVQLHAASAWHTHAHEFPPKQSHLQSVNSMSPVRAALVAINLIIGVLLLQLL